MKALCFTRNIDLEPASAIGFFLEGPVGAGHARDSRKIAGMARSYKSAESAIVTQQTLYP
jgi:hypothetical protein